MFDRIGVRVPVDEELLRRHAAHRSRADGYSEEFLDPALGGARTVAVMARPLGPARSLGWVMCHSFGLEQINLHRLEVLVARAMAAAGFPTLRFLVQGYGDSETRGRAVELAPHLSGTADAVELMRGQPGVDHVGVLGARFGATVAVRIADRLGLRLMGLWQPYLRGATFARDYVQTSVFAEMWERGGRGDWPTRGMAGDLEAQGWCDLHGFLFTKKTWDDIAAMDLSADVGRSRGAALVVGVSRTGAMPPEVSKVISHLRGRGVDCTEEMIADRAAPMLGQHHFQKVPGSEIERDSLHSVFRRIVDSTVRWALRQEQPSGWSDEVSA